MKWIIGLAVLLGGGYWLTTNWNRLNVKSIVYGPACGETGPSVFKDSGGALPGADGQAAAPQARLEFTSLPGGVHYSEAADMDELVMEAELSHKPILLFYVTSSCGYCKLMKDKVFADPEVAAFLSQQVLVKPVQIDETDGDSEAIKNWRADAAKLVKSHDVQAAPTFALCRPDGRRVAQAIGAMDAAKFLGWLREGLKEM